MLFSTDPLHIVLLALFLIMAVIQAWYWLNFYRRSAYASQSAAAGTGKLPPLSVVICARNEADNLSKFLPAVLDQDYPSFEVVVVNDCSEDNSFDVLGGMMKKYPFLKVSTIQKDPGFAHTKKLAMLIGIKAAKNDLLVFTDADCQPVSRTWLRHVASAAAGKAELIIGYGGYLPERASSTAIYVMRPCSPPCNTSEWPWLVCRIWVSDATWHTGEASFSTAEDLVRIIISCPVTMIFSSTEMPLQTTAALCCHTIFYAVSSPAEHCCMGKAETQAFIRRNILQEG